MSPRPGWRWHNQAPGTLQFPPVLWRSYQGLSDLLPGGWRGGREAAAQPLGGPLARCPSGRNKGALARPAGPRGGCRTCPGCLPRLHRVRLSSPPRGRGSSSSRWTGLAAWGQPHVPPSARGGGGRCVRRCRVVATPPGTLQNPGPVTPFTRGPDSRGSAAACSKPSPPRAGVCVQGRGPVALGPPTLTVAPVSPHSTPLGWGSTWELEAVKPVLG